MAPLKIALIQMRMDEDPARNLARALEKIDAAAQQGARVACLPELFRPATSAEQDTRKFDSPSDPGERRTEALPSSQRSAQIAIARVRLCARSGARSGGSHTTPIRYFRGVKRSSL